MSNTRLPQRQKDQHILKFFITLVQGELLGIFKKKQSIIKPLRHSVLSLHFFSDFKSILNLRKKMANGLAVIHHKATKGSPEGILIDLVFI